MTSVRLLCLTTALGCHINPTGGPSDTDPGFDGVYVSCLNEHAPGADESGGGDGDPNYWWLTNNGLDASCPTIGTCYKEFYGDIQICINDDNPEDLDIDVLQDWATGGYPANAEAVIRAQCSAECENLNQSGVFSNLLPPVCEDENWTSVTTKSFWNPSQGHNCNVPADLVVDIDGSSIPWNLVGGTSSPLPLDCDLDGDCASWFYPSVAVHIFPGSAGIIAPHTRTAHLFAAEGSGSQLKLEVDMSGTGTGVDDTEPLYGMAEYTWSECGQSVCPFYLGNLSAYNTTDVWDIRIDVGSGRIEKEISNVQIDLMQSTLGVQNMALDKVAFAPGSIRLRVGLTIDCESCDTTGNGTYVAIVENEDYVFADYDDGTLTLEHTFDMQSSGSATLAIEVVPGEFPPVAAHDLATTEVCDDPGGLVLDSFRSFSTDADSDIDFEMWWVDGEPVGHGTVIPVGAHTVSLEAHDTRGAVHRSTDHQVNVVSSLLGPS